jgi:hypothetical protein
MPSTGASGLKSRLYGLILVFRRGPLTDTYLQEWTSRWEDHRSKRSVKEIETLSIPYLTTLMVHINHTTFVESLKNMQHQIFQDELHDVVMVSSFPFHRTFPVYHCVRAQFICSERLIFDTLFNELSSMRGFLIRHMKRVGTVMVRPHRIHRSGEPKQIRLGSAPQSGNRQSSIRGKTWERTVTAHMPLIAFVAYAFQSILHYLLN